MSKLDKEVIRVLFHLLVEAINNVMLALNAFVTSDAVSSAVARETAFSLNARVTEAYKMIDTWIEATEED